LISEKKYHLWVYCFEFVFFWGTIIFLFAWATRTLFCGWSLNWWVYNRKGSWLASDDSVLFLERSVFYSVESIKNPFASVFSKICRLWCFYKLIYWLYVIFFIGFPSDLLIKLVCLSRILDWYIWAAATFLLW